MNTNEYIVNKLMQNTEIKHFLTWMKKNNHGCYVAGGAVTCIATGKHDNIEDYDIYFTDKHSAVAAIRYMKEVNCHVSFVSDKSISYAKDSVTKIQFIYTDFYPTADDIFEHFDFYICMGAYDNRDGNIYTHEKFWMHNAQKFLGINTKTLFPVISTLRISKYEKRGYKTSRNEMLKLSLAVANLNIQTWEQAKEQMGNTYGFTLADFKDIKDIPFSIPALIERIEATTDSNGIPMQEQYLYPHDAVDFVILNEPVQYVTLNGEEYLVDEYAADVEGSLENLFEKGILVKEEVDKGSTLEGDWFAVDTQRLNKGEVVKGWLNTKVYRKESLDRWNRGLIYKVSFSEEQISGFDGDTMQVSSPIVEELVCRSEHLHSFLKGDVIFRENARMKSQSSSGKNPQLTEERIQYIKDNVIFTGGSVQYARNTFTGVVLEGGEDITADELLYLRDGCGVPFGGSCYIQPNGCFSGEYNTD